MCATIIKGMAFQKATELFIIHVEGKKEKYVTQFTILSLCACNVLLPFEEKGTHSQLMMKKKRRKWLLMKHSRLSR
jgi:hypothetical protein